MIIMVVINRYSLLLSNVYIYIYMELLNIQLNGKIIILLFFEKKILILIKGLNIELKSKLN